jgi:hypothetical protein
MLNGGNLTFAYHLNNLNRNDASRLSNYRKQKHGLQFANEMESKLVNEMEKKSKY